MKIYLDLIMLLSFIFNSAILSLVYYLSRIKVHPWRFFLAVIVATLFVPLSLFFPHSFLHSVLGKGLYSFVIIGIAFRITNIHLFFKRLFMFYFVSFAFGGGILGIQYLFKNITAEKHASYLLYVQNYEGEQISLVLLFLGLPAILLFIKSRMDNQKLDDFQYRQLYEICIGWQGKRKFTKGFIDTGNHLVDPIFQRPVVICNTKFMEGYFPPIEWNFVKQAILKRDITLFPERLKDKFTLIPFQGVDGKTDFLIAFRPDNLTIQTNDQRIETDKVFIGIRSGEFSAEQQYDCLLHPHIIHFHSVQPSA